MLSQITYFQILGKPLIMWGGIITFLLLVATAAIQILNRKGITRIPIVWHKRMALITIASALVHGILGLANYF